MKTSAPVFPQLGKRYYFDVSFTYNGICVLEDDGKDGPEFKHLQGNNNLGYSLIGDDLIGFASCHIPSFFDYDSCNQAEDEDTPQPENREDGE